MIRVFKQGYFTLNRAIVSLPITYRVFIIFSIVSGLYFSSSLLITQTITQNINNQNQRILTLKKQIKQTENIDNNIHNNNQKKIDSQSQIQALSMELTDLKNKIKRINKHYFFESEWVKFNRVLLSLPNNVFLIDQKQKGENAIHPDNDMMQYHYTLSIQGSNSSLLEYLQHMSFFYEKIDWQQMKLMKNSDLESTLHLDFIIFVIPN